MFDFSTPITKDTTLVGVWDCNPIDPSNPTFEMVKAVLDYDDPASILPIGTEIPDTWNGNSNPMIIAQYLDSTNNSSYGGAEGVILLRKYIEPTSVPFGGSSDYRDRSNNIHAVLKDYYNKSSDALKAIMSTINIPYYTGSNMVPVPSDWFLMSGIEVCGTRNTGEGEQWAYWKNVTGLSSASNGTNTGRVKQDRDGNKRRWGLRSRYDEAYVWSVYTGGEIVIYGSSSSDSVLPACFVAKGSN